MYQQVEPLGLHEDIRAGVVASTIANVNKSKNQRVIRPDDFFPALSRIRRHPVLTQEEWESLKGRMVAQAS